MTQVPDETTYSPNTIHVLEGADRFGEFRATFGMPIAFKVASADTDGGVLIIENITPQKGGPPRHLHHAQEEWFYVVQGDHRNRRPYLPPGAG